MRILAAGFHTTYQYELAHLGGDYQFDYVESVWNSWVRPQPANVHLAAEPAPLSEYDLVLAHRVPDFVAWERRLAREHARTPIVMSFHTYPPRWNEYLSKIELPLHRVPRVLQGHPKVFVSRGCQLLWGFTADAESLVIPHAVDCDRWHDYRGEDAVILTVCNRMWEQDRYRGGSLFDIITTGLPHWLIGENPGRSAPAASPDALHEAYRSARVFLWTGLWGPPSFAPLEAMATGMPLVTIWTLDWSEVIQDGVNGFLCHDPMTMRQRCQELLNDRRSARQIGARGRETVRSRFGPEQFRRKWRDVFTAAAQGRLPDRSLDLFDHPQPGWSPPPPAPAAVSEPCEGR